MSKKSMSDSYDTSSMGKSESKKFSMNFKKLFSSSKKDTFSTSSSNSPRETRNISSNDADLDELLNSIRSGTFSGTTLNVTGIEFTESKLNQLLDSLRGTAIEELGLPNFPMNEREFEVLSENLAGNWTLTSINLTNVADFSKSSLEDFVRTTITLKKLAFNENDVPATIKESIRKYLDENRILAQAKANKTLAITKRGIRKLDYISHLLNPTLLHLNLSDNLLSAINDSILGTLVNLEELTLKGNQLRTLPASMKSLVKLTKLDVSNNKLVNLPSDVLVGLVCLKTLNVANNKLTDLYSLNNNTPKLKKIIAFGNPLSLPSGVLDEGEKLIPYLRKKDVEERYRTKLMIIGARESGKTSLADALTNKARKKQPITDEVVDITDYVLKTTVAQVELDVWDVSFTEDYYTQLFTDRALYLIVFALTDKKVDLLHWLQTIDARAKESLVILVGTHSDKVDKKKIEGAMDEIKNKYSTFKTIIDYMVVSKKDKSSIDKLRIRIADAVINSMPHLPESVPKAYRELEKQVKLQKETLHNTQKPPVMRLADFVPLAEKQGISQDDVFVALKYLHNLGVLAHYDKASEYIVLDPRWLFHMFKEVVINNKWMKQGLLDMKDLKTHIWNNPARYPEELHDYMIALLSNVFELIYKLPAVSKYKATYVQNSFAREAEAKGARGFLAFAPDDDEDALIIPSLLEDFASKEEYQASISNHWPLVCPPNQQELGRNYFFDFIPQGLVSRVVARFLNTSGWEPLLYWKNGILMVKSAGAKSADVQRDMVLLRGQQYHVSLNVRGKNPGTHLVNLTDSIETLVRDSLGVKVNISVTCTHCLREGSKHPFLFQLRECEKAVTDGSNTVYCKSRRPIQVSEVAPDIALSGVSDIPHISFGDIAYEKQIGEGAYAKVFLGKWGDTSVAVKELILNNVTTNEDYIDVYADFRKEVLLMSSLRHPNIVALKGVVMSPFAVVMELMPDGSLFDLIHDLSKDYDTISAVLMARDIAEAMQFLHNIPLVHRDLKSPNILLSFSPSANRHIAKVADFGLSRKVLLSTASSNSRKVELSQSLSKRTKTQNGKVIDNPVWLAPEVIKGEGFTFASDVYAFGVIMWELFSRKMFFGEFRFTFQIEDAVIKGERPPIPDENCPSDCQALIDECWRGEPSKREPFEKILERLIKVEAKLKVMLAARRKAEEAKAQQAAQAQAQPQEQPQSPPQ